MEGEGKTPLDGQSLSNKLVAYRPLVEGVSLYEKTLNFYLSIIPDVVVADTTRILINSGLYSKNGYWYKGLTQETVVARSKQLNLILLREREKITPYWYYCLDITNGTLPWVEITRERKKDMLNRTIEGFSGQNTLNDSNEYFLTFKKYCKNWLSASESGDMTKLPTLSDYLDNPLNLATTGASIDNLNFNFILEGVSMKARKTKLSYSLSHEVQEIMYQMGKIAPTEVHMSIKAKEKPPKLRPVSKESIGDYACESYVLPYIVARVQNNWNTTYSSPLFSSTPHWVTKMQQMLFSMQNRCAVVDTDADQFDMTYQNEENILTWGAILEVATSESWPNLKDITWCIEKIIERAKLGYNIKLNLGEKEPHQIQYNKGLISGRKTTAFQGTIKSSVVANIVIDQQGLRNDVLHVSTNGDDATILFKHEESNSKYMKGSDILNAQIINKQKSLTSSYKDAVTTMEYLKQIYSSIERILPNTPQLWSYGVPIRGLTSIMLKSPEASVEIVTPSAIRNNWLRLYSRGIDWFKMLPHMIKDISGRMRVSDKTTLDWLGTPSAFGGGGLQEYRNIPLAINLVKMDITHSVNKVLTFLPVTKAWLRWGITQKEIFKMYAPTLGVKPEANMIIKKIQAGQIHTKFINLNAPPLSYSLVPNKHVGKLMSLLIEQWISKYTTRGDKPLSELLSLTDTSVHSTLTKLYHLWTWGAFLEYIKGTLFVGVLNPDWSSKQVSVYFEPYKKRMFGLLSLRRSSRSDLLAANLVLESLRYKIGLSGWLPQGD